MFVENIKQFIKLHPEIAMITDRGLEDESRRVVFIAQDLDTRYPELVDFLNELKGIPKIERIEEVEKPKIEVAEVKKKSKKSKSSK